MRFAFRLGREIHNIGNIAWLIVSTTAANDIHDWPNIVGVVGKSFTYMFICGKVLNKKHSVEHYQKGYQSDYWNQKNHQENTEIAEEQNPEQTPNKPSSANPDNNDV